MNKYILAGTRALLIALIPLIMGQLLLFIFTGANVFEFNLGDVNRPLPFYLNDEIYHWRQSATFHDVQFEGGYYTLDEKPAALEMTHFYTWGPLPYVIYGGLSRFVPGSYQLYSSLLVNIFLITISAFVLITGINLDTKQSIYFAVFLAVFPAVVIFFNTVFLQYLHLSISFLIATVCFHFLKNIDNISFWKVVLYAGCIFAFALLRITWGLVLFPLLIIYGWERKRYIGALIGFITSAFSMIALFLIAGQLAAPYFGILDDVARYAPNVRAMISVFGRYTLNNVIGLFISGHPVELVFRVTIFALIVLSVYQIGRTFQKREFDGKKYDLYLAVFHIFNIAACLVLILMLNDTEYWRDFRTIAPHVALSLILILAFKQYKTLCVFLAVYVLLLPLTLSVAIDWGKLHYTPLEPEFEQQTGEYSALIAYDPDATDPWCNTVLINIDLLNAPGHFIGLDAGLGISWFADPWKVEPRSHYLLLTDSVSIPGNWQLEEMATLPDAVMYRNLAANCD